MPVPPPASEADASALQIAPRATPGVSALRPPRTPTRDAYLAELRLKLLDQVIASSSALLEANDSADVRARVEGIVERTIAGSSVAVTREERLRLVDDVMAEIEGFGPIEPLLRDETVTEIMVNGPHQVYVERKGKISLTSVRFRNDEHVRAIIDRIIAPLGRRIDESSPRVDARLPDGSRVNAVIAPLSLVGPVITVRKFATRPYTVEDLIGFGTSTAEMFEFLRSCVLAKLNIFVSGGTGSGKTTFLNVLSSFIPEDERIVTIEDAAELQLHQEHLITLESRPANLEGEGEITIRQLLRNALHMRPDRIIVGECRGGEALDMIQAMTVGMAGSLSTGHANSPPDMLRRLETMILMSGYDLPLRAIREQVSSGVDLIVHTARLRDGSRKVVALTEVYGIEDEDILTQDIFVYEQTGFVDGKVEGHMKATGYRPTFMPRFKEFGVELPAGEYGIPPEDPNQPDSTRRRKGLGATEQPIPPALGLGRARVAGGMVYVTSVGPVDPETGQLVRGGVREQTARCLRNLEARLESEGSSLGDVVWANWALREPTDFDEFNKEWAKAFPGDAPLGQVTVMSSLHRRAGFRISIGVIAEAGEAGAAAGSARAAAGAASAKKAPAKPLGLPAPKGSGKK
jgi:pilus assembly protein CpaF